MNQVIRTFVPGSQWLYLKLYGGQKTLDAILANQILSMIRYLIKQNRIDKWFFIRYSDPNYHLRIRFLVKDTQYIGEIIHLFYKKLNSSVKDNTVSKIQIDTYTRELERYGNAFIEEAESVFHIDSECILSVINKLNSWENENYRWMITLKMIDCFLSDFSYNLITKQQLLNKMADSYKKEFGFTPYNSKQFNVQFRAHKKTIESVLNNTITNNDFRFLSVLIERKSKKLKPVVQQLKQGLVKNKSENLLNTLVSSYIHMTLNRIFRSKNRVHELLIYDFMSRYYTSEIAKQKYNTAQ